MRIVIADDSDFMLERLQEMLNLVDQVEVVGVYNNGIEALAALKILNPDLAILDNKMPGLKGVDIIREIRKEDHTVKLMLLTFYSDSYYRIQAMKAGADYFFSKSEDFEKIPEVIAELINNDNYFPINNHN
ncbi:MAG: response regulator transcription factor [Prolixibacteraceae bacterium]|nr:response regulator transcription factor [Prolixibacteraceae bacterium]